MKYSDEELAAAINDLTRDKSAPADGGPPPSGPTGARGDADRDMALMAQAIFKRAMPGC